MFEMSVLISVSTIEPAEMISYSNPVAAGTFPRMLSIDNRRTSTELFGRNDDDDDDDDDMMDSFMLVVVGFLVYG